MKPTTINGPFYTIRQIADHEGILINAVKRRIDRGLPATKLPGYKGKWLIKVSDYEAFDPGKPGPNPAKK